MPVTKYFYKKATVVKTKDNDITDMFNQIERTLTIESGKRKFIHAYIPQFDSTAHKFGVNSKEVLSVFELIDDEVALLQKKINHDNALVIVIADHGFIDTSIEKTIETESIDGFYECQRLPMGGEARVRDCFIYPKKIEDFRKIVKDMLSEYCWIFPKDELVQNHFYGLGKINSKLTERIGDFVLIMKDNYTLKSNLKRMEAKEFSIGRHGGVTDDEMLVPLIVL